MKRTFFVMKCRAVTVLWKLYSHRRADTEVRPYKIRETVPASLITDILIYYRCTHPDRNHTGASQVRRKMSRFRGDREP